MSAINYHWHRNAPSERKRLSSNSWTNQSEPFTVFLPLLVNVYRSQSAGCKSTSIGTQFLHYLNKTDFNRKKNKSPNLIRQNQIKGVIIVWLVFVISTNIHTHSECIDTTFDCVQLRSAKHISTYVYKPYFT